MFENNLRYIVTLYNLKSVIISFVLQRHVKILMYDSLLFIKHNEDCDTLTVNNNEGFYRTIFQEIYNKFYARSK